MPKHRSFGTIVVLVIAAFSNSGQAAAAPPWSDAAALWHLGDRQEAAGRMLPLAIEGDVRLGVELTGGDRQASLCRGGDGRVGQFQGGYLRLAAPVERPLALQGKAMTLLVRLQDSSGKWHSPLLGKDAPADPYGLILSGADESLHYLWRTTPLAERSRTADVMASTARATTSMIWPSISRGSLPSRRCR